MKSTTILNRMSIDNGIICRLSRRKRVKRQKKARRMQRIKKLTEQWALVKMLPSKVVSTFTDTVYTDGSAPTHDGCANLLLLQKNCRKLRKNERRRGRAPLAWIRHCGTSLLKKIIMFCNIFNALFFQKKKRKQQKRLKVKKRKKISPRKRRKRKKKRRKKNLQLKKRKRKMRKRRKMKPLKKRRNNF